MCHSGPETRFCQGNLSRCARLSTTRQLEVGQAVVVVLHSKLGGQKWFLRHFYDNNTVESRTQGQSLGHTLIIVCLRLTSYSACGVRKNENYLRWQHVSMEEIRYLNKYIKLWTLCLQNHTKEIYISFALFGEEIKWQFYLHNSCWHIWPTCLTVAFHWHSLDIWH